MFRALQSPESLPAYQRLASEWASLVAHAGSGNVGRTRALLGALTYWAERERLEAGEDTPTAHVLGLESALKQVRSARSGHSQAEMYAGKMREWHAERVEHPMEELPRTPGGPRLLPELEDDPECPGKGTTTVSLFSGGFGLDLGFLQLGCDLRVALDFTQASRDVAGANLPRLEFVQKDVAEVSAADLLSSAGFDVGELTFLIGGPPCQPFSSAGKRRGLADPRAAPVDHFFSLVNEMRPRVFVMEEVPGLLSARMKDRASGTVWKHVLKLVQATGYGFVWRVLDAADYGAPQRRKRVIMVGVRDGRASLPAPTHGWDPGQQALFGPVRRPCRTFWEATADLPLPGEGESYVFTPNMDRGMRWVPPSGNWKCLLHMLPEDEVKELLGGTYRGKGGVVGIYRRLSWDAPSQTVMSTPYQTLTMLGHPEAPRPLSVPEYARVQGFPDSWKLPGSLAVRYKLIGNAVSAHLARALAEHCLKLVVGDVE